MAEDALGDARPTIYDVARRAGVSKSLVSLVLRGSASVSEPRRRAVLDAIEELGYQPSRAAATLAGSRSRSIGVVINDYRNMWFIDLLSGIRDVMDDHGYHVTISDTHVTRALRQDAVDGFLSMRVEGIVLATEPGNLRPRHLGVPVVVVGAWETGIDRADVVANDDAQGVSLAMEHLLGLGHRRIGHVSGSGGPAARRREAYETAMIAAGLEPFVCGLGGETTEEGGYLGTMALFAAHPEITAVFAANDTMALGALAALREHGHAVPEDVSLIGYDNSPLAEAHYLDLTTVDDKSFAVGAEAASALLARILQPDLAQREIYLSPDLIVRSSTGPVSRHS